MQLSSFDADWTKGSRFARYHPQMEEVKGLKGMCVLCFQKINLSCLGVFRHIQTLVV